MLTLCLVVNILAISSDIVDFAKTNDTIRHVNRHRSIVSVKAAAIMTLMTSLFFRVYYFRGRIRSVSSFPKPPVV